MENTTIVNPKSMVKPEIQAEPIEAQVDDAEIRVESPETLDLAHGYLTRSKDKANEKFKRSLQKQKELNVIVHPRLKPTPFKQEDLISGQATKKYNGTLIKTMNGINFYQFDDHPFNKRGFKYKACSPNPVLTSNLYSTMEYEPYSVAASMFDRAPGILLDETMRTITTLQGWRSVRANVPIREGNFYMEFNIIKSQESESHVRIGIARREASLEAPVGFDGYGYGLRDVQGQKITLSRPKTFMDGDGFKSGDIIGIEVNLPPLEEHRKAIDEFSKKKSNGQSNLHENIMSKRRKKSKGHKDPEEIDNEPFQIYGNIVRDQIPIRYKNALFYEQFDYTSTKEMEHFLNPVTVFGEKAILETVDSKVSDTIPVIPDSKIVVYRNGQKCGLIFENLYSFLPITEENSEANVSYNIRQQQNVNYRNSDDGTLGYYPMMSAFSGGIVELNPGPAFKYAIPAGSRPLSERYDEQVVDEWFWDIIDEVEAEYLDSFD